MIYAEQYMSAANPLRLGLALTYADFLYEYGKDVHGARNLAKTAFDLA